MPIIEGDENISDVDEDELSLHSSRLESDGSAIASTLHSESDSDLDRKFSIIFTFKYLDFFRDQFLFRNYVSFESQNNIQISLPRDNRSDRYSYGNSNRSKYFKEQRP